MKILIIEDEIRAALQLQSILKEHFSEIDILARLESIEDSLEWFKNNEHPHLIFMDIQLADGLSFEIFQHTTIDAPVIFTTAYDEYSIKAFKVNSIDYLLKPIQEADIKTAVKKYKKLYSRQSLPPLDLLTVEKLINNLAVDKSRKRFMVKEGSSMTFIPTEDVAYFYSEDGISFLVNQQGKRYIIDMPLDAIEKDVAAKNFTRINRGQIINIKSIEKIHPYFNHRLKIDVKGNSKLEFIVSRKRVNEFKAWINQ